MKKSIGILISLLAFIMSLFTGNAYAQSYKLMTASSGQQVFFGTATLSSGVVTVNVLPGGTVTAATATLASGFATGTATPRLAVTKSGGSITIRAYDDTGANTTSSAIVNYTGGGSQ